MGSFFKERPKYFNSKGDALNYSKEHLPHGGIFSQSVHHKLFERIGLFRWKLYGCYIRDTRYYNENGEDLAEPLENIVLACEHVKQHCDNKNNNKMFCIRAEYLHIFCKKRCEVGRAVFSS